MLLGRLAFTQPHFPDCSIPPFGISPRERRIIEISLTVPRRSFSDMMPSCYRFIAVSPKVLFPLSWIYA